MPFIFPTQPKASDRDWKSRDELFEMFMVEIGQYKRLPTWWIELVWAYVKQSELSERFKDWLKKKP